MGFVMNFSEEARKGAIPENPITKSKKEREELTLPGKLLFLEVHRNHKSDCSWLAIFHGWCPVW